jgi:hypothetical protein
MALTQIERLDTVAQSKVTTSVISYARITLLILTPLFVVLAVNSVAPFLETLLVALISAGGLVTSFVLWLNWRFKVYALSLWCFLFVIRNAISNGHPHSHTVLEWIGEHSFSLLFFYYGCALWLKARGYARANQSSFREEREKIEKWMDEKSAIAHVEFPTGSFWTGYWTYYIFNPEDCWVVARYKRGGKKLTSCRVYELKDVRFARLSSGKWRIDIVPQSGKKKSFVEVDLPVPFTSQPTLTQTA